MGRSQIAEELFNIHSKKNIGISAGTNTLPNSKEILSEVAPLTVKVLLEIGRDISNKHPVRLTEETIQGTDKIIFIADRKLLPNYLISSKKLIFWDIDDPDGKDYFFHKKMKKDIEVLIKDLVHHIG